MESHDLSEEEDRQMREENKRIEELIARQKLEYYKAIKNLHGSYTLLRKDRI